MKWLMTISEIKRIETARKTFDPKAVGLAETKHSPTPLKMQRGGVAEVAIQGPLLNGPDKWLDYLGYTYTIYGDIVEQSTEAIERGAKRVDYVTNSPGGEVDGLYTTMEVIRNLPVKTRTVGGAMMASAAYMLASQTKEIVAEDIMSMVGSVGVATSRWNVDFIKDIANSDSPKKRPDVATEEGVKAVQEELDDIYQVLAEKIADGRGVTVDVVKKKYGEGGMMTARTAFERNMIDGIIEQKQSAANGAVAEKESDMKTLDDLQDQHPTLYREALKAGATKERARVEAHLKLAKSSGDIETAHKDIAEGTPTGDSVVAHHASVQMDRREIESRQEEAASSVDAGGEPPDRKDPVLVMKAELEAECEGLTWEVFQ